MTAPRALPARIALAGLALSAALIGLVVREDRARAAGQEVRLAMEAVDPRSLLSGHYAALRLTETGAGGAPCPPGLTGAVEWIALAPRGDHHSVAGGAMTRDEALKLGPLAVKGSAYCNDLPVAPIRGPDEAPPEPERTPEPESQPVVTLDIGIDRFYADQDEALAIEAALREAGRGGPEAFAIVSVGADGRARLKGVEIGGERTELTWF